MKKMMKKSEMRRMKIMDQVKKKKKSKSNKYTAGLANKGMY